MSVLAHTSTHLSTAVNLLLCGNFCGMEITDVTAIPRVCSAAPLPSVVRESANAESKFNFCLKIRIAGNNLLKTRSCLL